MNMTNTNMIAAIINAITICLFCKQADACLRRHANRINLTDTQRLNYHLYRKKRR